MSNSTATAESRTSKPHGVVLSATILSGLVILSPLYWNDAGWIVTFGLLAVFPHCVLLARVLRRPGDRSVYALAIGVSVLMSVLGLLLLAVLMERWRWDRDLFSSLFVGGLLTTNLCLLVSAILRYRETTSTKPAWRILLASLLGPAVYYCVLFILASGAVVFARRG